MSSPIITSSNNSISSKNNSKKLLKHAILFSTCSMTFCSLTQAGGPEIIPVQATAGFFPLAPGLTLGGYVGNGSIGWGDALFPIYGSPNRFFLADVRGQYHTGDHYGASGGLGYRWLTEKMGILGGYVFGDYNPGRDSSNPFWFVSPGIEWLGSTLDFSANLYVPVSSQRQNTGIEWTDASIFNNKFFFGHTEFSQHDRLFVSTGLGGDAELGYRIPFYYAPEIFVGGYYFSPKDNKSVSGATVRVEMPLGSRVALTLSEAYDSRSHSIFRAGLNFSMGARYTKWDTQNDLAARMLDPIHRNLIAVAGSVVGPNQPIVEGVEENSVTVVEQDDIWFFDAENGIPFDPALGNANCTFNHPCAGESFNQKNVNTIDNLDSDASFFFTPGVYNLNNQEPESEKSQSLVELSKNQLAINQGQSLWGRTPDYFRPANSDFRPLFVGGFELHGENSLNQLNVTGHGTDLNRGIEAHQANHIRLHDVGVSDYLGRNGESAGKPGENAVGITISDASNISLHNIVVENITGGNGHKGVEELPVNLDDTLINASKGGNGGNASGIELQNVNNVDLNNIAIFHIKGGNGGDGAEVAVMPVTLSATSDESTGGSGGKSIGLNISQGEDIFASGLAIFDLHAGNGGAGGVALRERLLNTGRSGVEGGAGGEVVGVNLLDSEEASFFDLNIYDLHGGHGGKGGDGEAGRSENTSESS